MDWKSRSRIQNLDMINPTLNRGTIPNVHMRNGKIVNVTQDPFFYLTPSKEWDAPTHGRKMHSNRYRTDTGEQGMRITPHDPSVTQKQLGAVNKHMGVKPSFWAFSALFAGMEMYGGESMGNAVAKGIGESLLWEFAPGAMIGYQLATTLPSAGMAAADRVRAQGRWWNQAHRPSFGGGYRDTQQAITMRQAAVQAISGSKLNARSALGGEARMFHRPYTY